LASSHRRDSMAHPRHKASTELPLLRASMEPHLLKASLVHRAVLADHQRNLLSAMVRSR
jgi:hypothetical protein